MRETVLAPSTVMMSSTSASAAPSKTPRATVSTLPPPGPRPRAPALVPSSALLYTMYTSRFCSKSGCSLMSCRPLMKLSVMTSGIPAIGSDSLPSRKCLRRPGRSVIRIDSSGRKARLHGFSRPRASTETRMSNSAVWYSNGPSGNGGTGMPPRRCAKAEVATTAAAAAAIAMRRRLDDTVLPLGRLLSGRFCAKDTWSGRKVRNAGSPPPRFALPAPSPRVGFRLGLLEAIDQLGEVCAKLLERRRDTGRSFDARIVSTRGGAEQPRFQHVCAETEARRGLEQLARSATVLLDQSVNVE